jgi:hypothetical protein
VYSTKIKVGWVPYLALLRAPPLPIPFVFISRSSSALHIIFDQLTPSNQQYKLKQNITVQAKLLLHPFFKFLFQIQMYLLRATLIHRI